LSQLAITQEQRDNVEMAAVSAGRRYREVSMHARNKKIGLVLLALSILWIAGLPACTDSDVEVTETMEVPQVDDQLIIRGDVCTDPPEDSDFPVKIMFIIDSSGSMQQTDEGMQRVEAVRQVVRRYANNPQVTFNIIKFNGRVAVLTSGYAHLSGNEAEVFGPQGLQEADSMTDYQGALGVAYQELLNDMMRVADGEGGLPELTRSKYVVIFFSDGTPDPVCYGCVTDPPNHPRYLPECEGGAGTQMCCNDDLHVVCTLMDEIVLDMDYMEPGMFPMLEGGADYNHNYQIFQLIEAIMDLKDTFHVGEMRVHSAFLYCRDQFGNPTSALCAAAEEAYNLDPDRGRALLREIANRGNGTFRDFTGGQDINFLKIDYTSIKREYTAKNLIVSNVSAFPGIETFLPDSDGDGLDDDTEVRNGSDPLLVDTDGDGYQDFIENKKLGAGFDPLLAYRPDEACVDQQDSDGDGMRYCEEALYGTDDKLVDTDADGFPDTMEIRLGMDPLRNDSIEDLDSDGQPNADELLFHSHPGRSDEALWDDHRYWYEMWPLEDDAGDRKCYGFEIRHLTLVTTRDRNGPGSRGFNDIVIWFDQASYDDPLDPGRFKAACVRAQYIEPDYKIPLGGEIELSNDDFVHPGMLDLGFSGSSCVTADK